MPPALASRTSVWADAGRCTRTASTYVLKEWTRLLVIPYDIVVVLHRCVSFLQVFLFWLCIVRHPCCTLPLSSSVKFVQTLASSLIFRPVLLVFLCLLILISTSWSPSLPKQRLDLNLPFIVWIVPREMAQFSVRTSRAPRKSVSF